KDLNKAQETMQQINQNFHSYVSKGILTKNTAARKVSRLNASVKKLAPANA
ncbi:30S ribosomal protein S20, partial [Helicobacter sp.]